MKIPCTMKMIPTHAFFAFILICMSGCIVMGGNYTANEPFKEAQVNGIKRGETTKREILEWFGPPVAIARKGTTMTFPPPGPRKVGYKEVPSEIFFEMFSAKNEIIEEHIIYYYYYSSTKVFSSICIPAGTHERRLAVDELWILINERTGIVEDYLFRLKKK